MEDIVGHGDRSLLVVKRFPRRAYRRVLVSVDFSENSRKTLEFALRLAPEAEFNVLYCYEGIERQLLRTDVPPSEVMRYRRQFAKKARQAVKGFLDTVRSGRKRLIAGIWLGRAPHVIPMVAKRLRADLVAVGTKGRTGLSRILVGSMAKHVIRQVDSDVLVVRSKPVASETGSTTPRAA
jgi:nucleotide-binding universal stress UspA family protein